ncbi:MAG TPA: polysaccharide deacetylase family protein [Terriglobales bacterium]|nr:polysaccharide deacetylase family protein [Terriglobales bacterium]
MRLIALLAVAMVAVSAWAAGPPERQVAITVDDLPAAAAERMSGAQIDEMTAKLVGTLHDQKVPAVGFVNAGKLFKWGEVDERIKALQIWLDNGFELGNHTYSHASLNRVGLKDWEDEVIEGEPVLKQLLAEHHMKLRYLRHPYLDTGKDLQTRRAAEAFLSARGYSVAPVTLDAWDWMYAPVYADAKKRGDAALEQKLVSSYLSYSNDVFAYSEQLSTKITGYEVKQILLLHGNELEADHIGELLDVLRKRGYRFITLQEALSDPAYGMPDTYVGEEGTGWLDHWAITQGKPPQGAPVFPQWVMERAERFRQAQP